MLWDGLRLIKFKGEIMGFRGLSSLLIVFLILALLFGTRRLREIGNDLGAAVRNFRKGLQEDKDEHQ